MSDPQTLIDTTARLLDDLREQAPLVQCITNSVVTNFTANAMLSLGAPVAMTDIPTEAGPFAEIASGLLINLGTPHAEPREAMLEAADAAGPAGTPWVLDPVAVGSLPVRTQLAQDLLAKNPTVVRGNASEIIALAGTGAGGRGVDSSDSVEDAADAARTLTEQTGGVVAVSGETDLVTDGRNTARLSNGTPLLTQITGGGCALGAVMAAFASLSEDRLETTVAAVTVYNVAAEIATDTAEGPGSFAVAFIDALNSITAHDVQDRAVIA